jgi:hypothetical protein
MAQERKQNDQQNDQDSKQPLGVGSFLGGLAKKAAAKKAGGDEGDKQRSTFLTGTTEVLKVATALTATDVAIPPGFKENK